MYIMIYWDNQLFGEFYGIQVLARYKKTTFTNLREHPSRTSDALCAAPGRKICGSVGTTAVQPGTLWLFNIAMENGMAHL